MKKLLFFLALAFVFTTNVDAQKSNDLTSLSSVQKKEMYQQNYPMAKEVSTSELGGVGSIGAEIIDVNQKVYWFAYNKSYEMYFFVFNKADKAVHKKKVKTSSSLYKLIQETTI